MNWFVLIGFMGSGKSTIGEKLAEELHLPFVDTDMSIEKKEGKSIRDLFDGLGEQNFREIEADFIRSLDGNRSMVLAVGGGLPLFHNNMEFLNARGLTIYLKHDPKELTKRLRADRSHRPLIAQLSEIELIDYIENSLALRETIYRQARITLASDQQDIPTILHALKNWKG